MDRSRFVALLCAVVGLLGLPAMAIADTEPNDGITQTEGPLRGGTPYSGTLATENDSDWYAFYARSQTQLDVAVTAPGSASCSVRFTLMDSDGGEVDSADVDPDETVHFRYTTPPGTQRFLLAISDACVGDGYQFTLGPAASIVSGPGRPTATPTPEPNEDDGQSTGPLFGGRLYAGSIDTENDQDWFFFYTSGTQAFDVAVTGVDGCGLDATLDGPGADGYASDISPNSVTHFRVSPPGPERYTLAFTPGCPGSGYQFRVDPPSALAQTPPREVTPPPPPPPDPCNKAKRSVKKWTKKVKKTKKALKRAKSRRKKRKLRKLLGAQKRALKRARDRKILYCP